MIRALKDPDLHLPIVHLDTPDPITVPDSDSLGFSFADERSVGKRSLDDKHHNPVDITPHGGDPLLDTDHGLLELPGLFSPTGRAQAKLVSIDAPQRERDLRSGTGPESRETHDSHPSQQEGIPKKITPKDAALGERDESLTELADDVIQPFENASDPTPDPNFPMPQQGWIFSSAPPKRSSTNPASTSKYAPIRRDGSFLTNLKDALRGISS